MRAIVVLALICLLPLLMLFSLVTGPATIPPMEGIMALWREDFASYALIIREIRLPRTLLGVLIGFGLGLSGAAMQGFLRNPLAEPGVIGISAAAALGAVFALQMGFARDGQIFSQLMDEGALAQALALPGFALLGALMASLCVLIFAGGGSMERLILVGIGISAICGALTALVLNLSPNPFAAYEIMYWLMGSLANRSQFHVFLLLPFVLIGAAMIFSHAKSLDALSLGEDTAQSLGVSIMRLRLVLIIGVTLIVGASTAIAGAIGFVGLVVPHMLRPLIGARPSRLLLAAGLGGACLLLTADILARLIAPIGRDLQLGVLTALIGAPLFLHLVMKTRGR